MTFRDDADALRAKLEATEAENTRLRDEMKRTNEAYEALHERERAKVIASDQGGRERAKKQKAAARRAWWRERWLGFKRTLSYGIGALIGGGAIVGAILAAIWGAEWLGRYRDELLLERHNAEVARLNDLRAQVPDGVDPALWSWCVSHCIRYGQAGTSGTYEGVVSDVFIDYADGTVMNTRATVRGPWLTESGATAISTSFPTPAGVQRGDLIIVRNTANGWVITQASPPAPIP